MQPDGLFSLSTEGQLTARSDNGTTSGFVATSADSPLAVRMRPAGLDELVGQEHLLAAGSPLRRLVTGGAPQSVILWGPPGCGKTTIAHLVAGSGERHFVALSALNAGVKEVREVIDTARRRRRTGGPPTILFIDEVHRFTKTQQDSLLAAVEDRTVTLLAATTENPYFSVISPLLSRCVLLTLKPLDDDDVRALIRRAVTDERGLGGAVSIAPDAEDHLVRLAGGDVRKALTALEAAADSALATEATVIDLSTAERAVDVAALRYDRAGDAHYDVTSAFIKSLRGSDVDAALHYLARMLVAGEDPRFIARRMMIFASEDVGLADPTALTAAVNASYTVQNVGLPEAQLNLAQAAIHLATAPKSNAVTTAIFKAIEDVRAGKAGPVPSHLRDAHYSGARGLGHGAGYRYPHDDAHGVVTQQYPPDELVGVDYYRPTGHGAERQLAERVPKLRRAVRGGAPLRPERSDGPTARSANLSGASTAAAEAAQDTARPAAAAGAGGTVERAALSAENRPAAGAVGVGGMVERAELSAEDASSAAGAQMPDAPAASGGRARAVGNGLADDATTGEAEERRDAPTSGTALDGRVTGGEASEEEL